MRLRQRFETRAFTLIELLVSITIISILASLTVSGVGAAKKASRRIQCLNNLRQLGLAMNFYHQDSDGFFPLAYQAGWDNYITDLAPYLKTTTFNTGWGEQRLP
ncbi:MAG: type II secretion system protein, partial [Verrucomicrobiae bacterium]|nr:type II secretion system protein [Verrucomicrobiae bacterium]